MCVKPVYFVSRTIGETSSYFNVIFLRRFSIRENTNVRTRNLRYFCGVRLAGITARKNNGIQAPAIFVIFDAVHSLV